MKFNTQFNKLILACKDYQQMVEDKNLWFVEPYQTKYLWVNQLLIFYDDERTAIETVAAIEADKNAPDFIDLTTARELYHSLKYVIPSFLAEGPHYYFWTQTYYVHCIKMLKSFSYSTFRPDFDKSHQLINWLSFLRGAKEKHDTVGSIQKSIDDIKKMGHFESLDAEGIQKLQAEVHNIQTLLLENPDAIDTLSPEDSEIFRYAAQYVEESKYMLLELPPIEENFEFDHGPLLETVSYRCQQLIVQADDFPDVHPKTKKVLYLYEFKQQLKDTFNHDIPICADIYATILGLIGAQNQLSILDLCKIIHRAIEPFVEDVFLRKRYSHLEEHYTGLDIDFGLPDTYQLSNLLCVAIGVEIEEYLVSY